MTKSATRIAWFHCFAGIAGDMALGSLLDAGADLGAIRDGLAGLPFAGWTLDSRAVLRSGIAATQAIVTVSDDGVERTWPVIRHLIEESKLADRVRERALATFSALAAAEAQLHGKSIDEIHFHEVGGHDAIIDIVGCALALELLNIDQIYASPVATGTGMIRCAHGLIPNPGPAVLKLLTGAPLIGRDLDIELTTPTGAALLAAHAQGFGPLPAMTIEATGYGAGQRDLEGLPNCTEVVIGTAVLTDTFGSQPLVVLEANLDDATGEQLSDTIQALLDVGALDAWVTPIVMKKGRPGHLVSALAPVALVSQLREALMLESGSFGVRASHVDRWAAAREMHQVDVDGHVIGIKVGLGRAKVEHDDAARAARSLGIPIREVIARVEHAWRLRKS